MSILIPGKMPTSWEDCAFSNEFAECLLDKDFTVCAFARMGNGCPIIEIPPHGRLIDADALERNLREMAGYQHGDRQQGILGCCSTICSADTIIPADPEKEDDLK